MKRRRRRGDIQRHRQTVEMEWATTRQAKRLQRQITRVGMPIKVMPHARSLQEQRSS